jgi:hypothetical protein
MRADRTCSDRDEAFTGTVRVSELGMQTRRTLAQARESVVRDTYVDGIVC